MPNTLVEQPPFDTPLLTKAGALTDPWRDWYQRVLLPRVQQSSPALLSVEETEQSASIGVTSLLQQAQVGLYRLSFGYRVTTAASVSSSLAVSVTAIEDELTTTQTSAAFTGNNPTLPQSAVFIVRSGAASPISYSTNYASVGTAMEYGITVVVEQLV